MKTDLILREVGRFKSVWQHTKKELCGSPQGFLKVKVMAVEKIGKLQTFWTGRKLADTAAMWDVRGKRKGLETIESCQNRILLSKILN